MDQGVELVDHLVVLLNKVLQPINNLVGVAGGGDSLGGTADYPVAILVDDVTILVYIKVFHVLVGFNQLAFTSWLSPFNL